MAKKRTHPHDVIFGPKTSARRQQREVPRQQVEHALLALRLPSSMTFEQIRSLPLRKWKDQYVAIYHPNRWKSTFTPAQREAYTLRFSDTIGAFNTLIYWQEKKIFPVTAAERAEAARDLVREIEFEEMIQAQAAAWERDAPMRLAKVQAEAHRQAALRAKQSGHILTDKIRSADWRVFEKEWHAINVDKPAQWFKGATGLAMRREAWLMWQQGQAITREVVRVLQQRIAPDIREFTDEQKRAAHAWYIQVLRNTAHRWVHEILHARPATPLLPAKFKGLAGVGGFGAMFG